ncbi:MAG: phytoene desaturase family protein [Marinicellaceae bacterium]
MKDYDAIVIGAGNAGLTAAVTLQKAGSKTLLLEKHNIPGGCATSFVRGEFEFEVALHQLSGLGTEKQPFIMRKIFHELGVMDKVEFTQESDLYRMVVKDGVNDFDITLPACWDGIKNTLSENFPDEKESISQFMLLCEKICIENFMYVPKARKKSDQEMLSKMAKKFVQYGLRSAKDVLDEFFKNEQLKTILAAYWCYLGLPPSQMAFSDLAIMLFSYGMFKPWHIKGGSQALSSALLESFLQAGGEVRFNCAVEKILTNLSAENPEVKAIKTEHGDVISCYQIVSNASSVLTYGDLLDLPQMPVSIKKDFKSREVGTSAFCLYLGLDCSPEELGISNASTFLSSSIDEELMHDTMKTMNPPVATMLTCYNVDDPSFAPEGKTQVSLLCLQYGKLWEDVPIEDYAETKYAFAEHLLAQAELTFPGIKACIEEVEVATPLTMMRYLNTPEGAIYGFQQNPEDSSLYRERIESVTGLHLAGSWNGMGGFQPTYMMGASTGRYVSEQIKKHKINSNHIESNQEASHV